MQIELPNVKRSQCPRCGYDQRGVVATWTDCCPLYGTCSECGLQFNWANVIVPDKFEPPWCVEFAPRLLGLPRAAVKTFFISFWPWTFWSRLQMSQQVRWRRLALYAFFLLFPLLLCYVITQAALAARMRYQIQQQVASITTSVQPHLNYEQSSLAAMRAALQYKYANEQEREAILSKAPPNSSLGPKYAQFIQELAQASDENLNSMIATKQQTVALLQAQINTPPKIRMSYVAAILEAVIQPLAQWSSGSIQLGDGTVMPYPSPIEIHDLIGSFRTGQLSWSDDLFLHLILTIACILLLLILLPASFILLPFSRRRAKVRWAHVVRIFVYSLFAFISTLLIVYTVVAWHLISDSQWALNIYRAIPSIAWIGITIWWAVAIKRYLKMAHAEAVAGVMSLMLALLMSPALLHIVPPWLSRLLFD